MSIRIGSGSGSGTIAKMAAVLSCGAQGDESNLSLASELDKWRKRTMA